MNTSWRRVCPICKRGILYEYKCSWKRCSDLRLPCKACAAKIRGIKNTKPRIPILCKTCQKVKYYLLDNEKARKRSGMNCKHCALQRRPSNRKGKKMPRAAKILLSKKLSGKNHPQYGKSLSDEHKHKIRVAVANDMANKKHYKPNYNLTACRTFDRLNHVIGLHIQHAENGGEVFVPELGYWLDGYDKENNVVYEWYEKHHFKPDGTMRRRDIVRIHEIKNLYDCDFCAIIEETGDVVFINDSSITNRIFTE